MVVRFVKLMNVFSCIILFCLPLLIVTDVVSRRFFGTPILGVIDITEMFGGLMIFLALPFATAGSQQIAADFLLQKFPPVLRVAANIFTRCLGVFLFLVIGWNMILKGLGIYLTGEVSATLKLPLYPATFVAGFLCFLQCLVLIADGVRRSRLK
jgi:TRAP-type C4-dicarboxylate transport system permease small subunit